MRLAPRDRVRVIPDLLHARRATSISGVTPSSLLRAESAFQPPLRGSLPATGPGTVSRSARRSCDRAAPDMLAQMGEQGYVGWRVLPDHA